MKLQAVELPLMKNQTRRNKTNPKIAPLVAITLFLLTIIPIYYPFLRYPNKNSSSDDQQLSSSSSSSSRISSQLSLCQDDDPLLENGQCSHKDVEKTPTTSDDREPVTTTNHGGDVEESPALSSNSDRDVETKPAVSNPDVVETTRSDEDVTRSTTFNRDSEATRHRGDVEEPPTLSSNSDRDGETKPALSNPEAVETTHPDEEEEAETTQLLPVKDAKTTRSHRRRDVGKSSPSPPTPSDHREYSDWQKAAAERENCNIFSGEWVPNPEAPYYTNSTCRAIQEHQDCLKFGRPDKQYLKWKWKPEGCELPVFDPFEFMEHVRGKSLAFVGDSVARNHMQSLICLLSTVEEPVDVSEIPYGSQFKRYEYPNHNFTVEIFWSPYLVRTTQTDDSSAGRPFNLFLDEFDEKWTTKISHFDYVIISAGHWFFRPTMFYVEGRVVGCLYCPESNITHLTTYFSYRRAFRTAFRAINNLESYKGITFLRTFAPSHFEGGYWDKGGNCVRKRPFRNAEARLEGYNMELYKIQVEELKIAERSGRRKGLKFRLFDVTQAMLLRPDGHPSKYGHWPQANVSLANDCVHWCLPGAVDTWNDFLIEMLRREEKDIV